MVVNGLRISVNRTENKIFNRYEIVAKNPRGAVALYKTAHTKRGANKEFERMIDTISKFYKRVNY